MNPVYYLVIIAVGFAAYYLFYYRRIKALGGNKEAGKLYWREQFALEQDEDVVSMGRGMWYLGPLVPETDRSTGEKVFDAVAGISYRAAGMWLAFTSKERFAIAVEETDDGPKSQRTSLGTKSGYAPFVVYDATTRPRMEIAAHAWPGSDQLPTDKQKPEVRNFNNEDVRLELVRLTDPSGQALVFFVEPEWVEAVGVWCSGGPHRVEARYVE